MQALKDGGGDCKKSGRKGQGRGRKMEEWREKSSASPSSDNKAFPMTHLSGQELKPGNRKQRARRRGYDDGETVGKEKETETMEKNNTGSQREKTRSKIEHACLRVTQGSWVNADYSGCVSCVYVCVTFIELGVLWKPRCPEPITSLLSLNLWKAKKKQRHVEYTHQHTDHMDFLETILRAEMGANITWFLWRKVATLLNLPLDHWENSSGLMSLMWKTWLELFAL